MDRRAICCRLCLKLVSCGLPRWKQPHWYLKVVDAFQLAIVSSGHGLKEEAKESHLRALGSATRGTGMLETGFDGWGCDRFERARICEDVLKRGRFNFRTQHSVCRCARVTRACNSTAGIACIEALLLVTKGAHNWSQYVQYVYRMVQVVMPCHAVQLFLVLGWFVRRGGF